MKRRSLVELRNNTCHEVVRRSASSGLSPRSGTPASPSISSRPPANIATLKETRRHADPNDEDSRTQKPGQR
jgi:hypothetical protein